MSAETPDTTVAPVAHAAGIDSPQVASKPKPLSPFDKVLHGMMILDHYDVTNLELNSSPGNGMGLMTGTKNSISVETPMAIDAVDASALRHLGWRPEADGEFWTFNA